MKYIAERTAYGSVVQSKDSCVVTEVTADRVRGYETSWWTAHGRKTGQKPFDVKRHDGNRFFKGSGSGKISYTFKEIK